MRCHDDLGLSLCTYKRKNYFHDIIEGNNLPSTEVRWYVATDNYFCLTFARKFVHSHSYTRQNFESTYLNMQRTTIGPYGWEPWSSGYGKRFMFWRSWVRVPAPYTLSFSNIIMFQKTKINVKGAGVAQKLKNCEALKSERKIIGHVTQKRSSGTPLGQTITVRSPLRAHLLLCFARHKLKQAKWGWDWSTFEQKYWSLRLKNVVQRRSTFDDSQKFVHGLDSGRIQSPAVSRHSRQTTFGAKRFSSVQKAPLQSNQFDLVFSIFRKATNN